MKKAYTIRAGMFFVLLLACSTFLFSMEQERQEPDEDLALALQISAEEMVRGPREDGEKEADKPENIDQVNGEKELLAQESGEEGWREKETRSTDKRDTGKEKVKERGSRRESGDEYDHEYQHNVNERITYASIQEYLEAEIKRLTTENKKMTDRKYRNDNADDLLVSNAERLENLNREKIFFNQLKDDYNECQVLINQLNQLRKLGAGLKQARHPNNFETLAQKAYAKLQGWEDVPLEINDNTDFRVIREIIVKLIIKLGKKREELDMQIRNLPYLPTFGRGDFEFDEASQELLRPDPIFLPDDAIVASQEVLLPTQSSELLQLKVLRQGPANGGSGSCGYHAVKNGAVIIRLLLSNKQQRKQLLHELLSAELVNITFGNNEGLWRSKVICKVRRKKVKNFIQNMLTHLWNVFVTELNEGPNLIFANVATALSDECAITLQQTGSFFIQNEKIIETFTLEIQKPRKQACPYLQELIENYLPNIANVEFKINSFGIREIGYSSGVGGFGNLFNKENNRLECDWLEGNQMDEFIEDEKTYGMLKNINYMPFLRIGDGGWIDGNGELHQVSLQSALFIPHKGEDAPDEAKYGEARKLFLNNPVLRKLLFLNLDHLADIKPYLDQKLQEILNEEKDNALDLEEGDQTKDLNDYFYDPNLAKIAVLIRDPESSFICPIAFRVAYNHWISVVINKVHNHIQYIIADSSETNQLHNNQIKELVCLLEGRRPDESSCILF